MRILLSSRFLKKKKKKGNIEEYPILRYREDGEFLLLIKEQRDYLGRFKVYFRMSVAQFDALLAIQEPHIKLLESHFCELSVQGSTVLCAARWSGWTSHHSGFWRSLVRWLWTVKKTSQNACYGCEKWKKIKPDTNLFMTDKNFGGSV